MDASSVQYDEDEHIKNIHNPEANRYCPNNNPVITFAGRKWWINYHWSPTTGTWADDPFKSNFDPMLFKPPNNGGDSVKLWIIPKPGPFKCVTSEIVLVEKLGWGAIS